MQTALSIDGVAAAQCAHATRAAMKDKDPAGYALMLLNRIGRGDYSGTCIEELVDVARRNDLGRGFYSRMRQAYDKLNRNWMAKEVMAGLGFVNERSN